MLAIHVDYHLFQSSLLKAVEGTRQMEMLIANRHFNRKIGTSILNNNDNTNSGILLGDLVMPTLENYFATLSPTTHVKVHFSSSSI